MPTGADRWAVDTSVAVPYVDEGHAAHAACVAALGPRRVALAGHAAFETYAVLTRLPGDAQVDGFVAAEVLAAAFDEPCWLTADEHHSLLRRLGTVGVVGGAAYDALVGEAARLRGRSLFTRDRRARRTYDLLGVEYRLVD